MNETLIIIPAYNSENYLRQCIESVRAQSYTDWHLVIVDDGSKDGTAAIAREIACHDDRITLVTQPNAGVAAARNRGLTYLSEDTRYVMCLDNDDFLEIDALEILRDQLKSNPSATAAFGYPREVGKHGEAIDESIESSYGYRRYKIDNGKLAPSAPLDAVDFGCMAVWDPIVTPGQALVRRSSLDAVGGFDPATVPSDDWDLWLRLLLRGPIVPVERFVINKRTHGENVSGQGKAMAGAEPALRRKLATSPLLTPEQRQLAKLGHFYSCYIKLTWASQTFDFRRPHKALRPFYSAAKSYARYLKTSYETGQSRQFGTAGRVFSLIASVLPLIMRPVRQSE